MIKRYKVAKNPCGEPSKYFNNLMKAIDMKEAMKKLKKDGYLYHVYTIMPGKNEEWYKLE